METKLECWPRPQLARTGAALKNSNLQDLQETEACTNKDNRSISKAEFMRLSRQSSPCPPNSPFDPATKRLTNRQRLSDTQPDPFDNQVTADGNKILREPPQADKSLDEAPPASKVSTHMGTPIQPLLTDDEKVGRDIHDGE